MADTQVCPVARGKTWYGDETIDTNNYGTSVDLEGRTHVFLDTDPTDRMKKRSHNDVKAILVRNVTGHTLYAGQWCTWASGYRKKRVGALSAATAAEVAGVVDDHIGSGGVRNGDLFWLVVDGNNLTKTPMAGTDFVGDWSAGDVLYALTAAGTTGGTTAAAGRLRRYVGTHTSTATTDGTGSAILMNRCARAVSAATTGETNTLKLVDVKVLS